MSDNWQALNQQFLIKTIASLRQALTAKIQSTDFSAEELTHFSTSQYPDTALERLSKIFGLSEFECNLLVFCAGMELDSSWASLCAQASGDRLQNYPTFSLALEILPQPVWGALIPNAPLRKWQLIEIGAGNALTHSPLRLDERILHYLLGISHLDEKLTGLVQPLASGGEQWELPPSQEQLSTQIAQVLATSREITYPVVQLCGDDDTSKRAIAKAACQSLGWNIHSMIADAIPTTTSELNKLTQLWEREALLSNSLLLLDCEQIDANDTLKQSAIARFIAATHYPLIVSSRERRHFHQRHPVTFDIQQPTTQEQLIIWQKTLGVTAQGINSHLETLVSHFNLSFPTIYAACLEAKTKPELVQQEDEDTEALLQVLWDTCRIQARSHMDDLAQRIESKASWDDLVLPEQQKNSLRQIVAHVRQRARVYETWGFAAKSERGLGISALFAGASGTGKTMAADVMAKELKLDLYRIDLSSVISKYIGETEKNLRRVFDAAEAGGCILLFDEADAIFGKRSEVKDSHDRHANIEVSYLLQRMESYRGLAILTTNLKNSLDQAFLRRIRFVIQFPFPDATQREEIWRRVFPKETPTAKLDARKLAKLNVAGGNIRNIALNATFMAAETGEPVQMKHLLESAKSEYLKLERPLTDVEVKGWV